MQVQGRQSDVNIVTTADVSHHDNIKSSITTVTLRASYKFGGPFGKGPVVAGY